MKKLLLSFVILLISINSFGQLTLNSSNNFYESSKVILTKDSEMIDKLENRFNEINLTEIKRTKNKLTGHGFTNHLVSGFANVEIKYKVRIDFKESKYKLTLTNFTLKDVNGEIPLEGAGNFKKKWIKKINKKLPEIISNIENFQTSESSDW